MVLISCSLSGGSQRVLFASVKAAVISATVSPFARREAARRNISSFRRPAFQLLQQRRHIDHVSRAAFDMRHSAILAAVPQIVHTQAGNSASVRNPLEWRVRVCLKSLFHVLVILSVFMWRCCLVHANDISSMASL